MPAYTSFQPAKRFFCKGMNLNRPIDSIPDNQYALLYNVRSYSEGRIEGRPGLQSVFGFPGSGGYIHSGYTLGDYNPDSSGGPVRFAGYNTEIYAGTSPPGFPDNYTLCGSGYSGNPLSMVANSPNISPIPWLYVYDSNKQQKFSQSFIFSGVPEATVIGLPTPWVRPTGISKSAGGLTGSYYYRFQILDPRTGVLSQPGPPTHSTVDLVTQQANIPVPFLVFPDLSNAIVRIYRFGGAVNDWRLVGSQVADGSTFTDNLSDNSVPPASSGGLDQTRFQPWISQDITRTSGANITAAVLGTGSGDGVGSIITRSSGAFFNVNWIPGTEVIVTDPSTSTARPATLVNFIGGGIIEVQEDLGNISGATVRVVGALESGVPFPYVWGPYGAGLFGLYLFACGDPHAPGRLYWTTGNDPDSTNPQYSLDITDPSEPLQNGCIYNGRCFVWSSERMWEITPSLTVASQFVAQVIAGARGLFANWGFAVGDYIYFRAKDGIYRTSGGLPESITDKDLYQLFEHDGQPGFTITLPNPEDFTNPIQINPPDPQQVKSQRLCYGDGQLYFDYKEANTGLNKTLVYAKFPGQGGEQYGWILDDFIGVDGYTYRYWEKGTTLAGTQTPAHSLLVGVASTLYQFTGVSDAGNTIKCSVMIGASDLGDSREPKLIGDAVVWAIPNGGTVTARLLGADNTAQIATGALVASGGAEGQTILDVNSGTGVLDRTCGLWLHWEAAAQTVQVLKYNFYWVPKPDVIQLRATDWTDDGLAGSKYWKAVVIEANVSILAQGSDMLSSNTGTVTAPSHSFTSTDIGSVLQITGGTNWKQDTYTITAVAGIVATLDHSPGVSLSGGSYILSGSRQVQLQYDGGSVAQTIQLVGAGQTEMPYAIVAPPICREMRVLPVDASTCEIFKVRFVWEPYPEFLQQVEDYSLDRFGTNKYVRGVRIEGDTQGNTINFTAQYDGVNALSIPSVTQAGKTLTVIGFATPFIASEIRLLPLGKWRRHSVQWIFDEYPDYAVIITPWSDEGGGGRTRYVRGGILHVDTGATAINVDLQVDGGVLGSTIQNVSATGQSEFPFAISPPILTHLSRFVPRGTWRYWNCVWDQDIYPELLAEYSPVIDIGPGAQFLQGVRLTADTNGQPVSFKIMYDGGQVGAILPATVFRGKQTIPFSFPPFVAHNLQVVPLQPARVFYPDTEWVKEPAPDLAVLWQTQPTDHDLPGYHHLRAAWIAYQSAPTAFTNEIFKITTEYNTMQYSLPVATNYARPYLVLAPQKAKWRSYQVVSALGVRMFVKDTIILAKGWGAGGAFGQYTTYNHYAPFGDFSRAVGARI